MELPLHSPYLFMAWCLSTGRHLYIFSTCAFYWKVAKYYLYRESITTRDETKIFQPGRLQRALKIKFLCARNINEVIISTEKTELGAHVAFWNKMTYISRPDRQGCSRHLLPDYCRHTCRVQLELLILTAIPDSGCSRLCPHLRCWTASYPAVRTTVNEPSVLQYTLCLCCQSSDKLNRRLTILFNTNFHKSILSRTSKQGFVLTGMFLAKKAFVACHLFRRVYKEL